MADKKDKKREDDWDEEDPFEHFVRRFFGSRSPFDEFFREVNEIMRKFMKEFEEFSIPVEPKFIGKKSPFKHYVYGFSITIGPDGKPRIKEFGNVKPFSSGVITREEFEPLSTVYSEDDKIKVIVDLPGAKKETIKINASENDVEVMAEAEDRKYYKKINLPTEVIPESAKARYNNGILEIVFDKKKKVEKRREIKVEWKLVSFHLLFPK